MNDLVALPGGALVAAGLADRTAGRTTPAALLVSLATSQLAELGVAVPGESSPDGDLELYALLCAQSGDAAYVHYKALRGELVSFLAALASLRRRESGA